MTEGHRTRRGIHASHPYQYRHASAKTTCAKGYPVLSLYTQAIPTMQNPTLHQHSCCGNHILLLSTQHLA